VMVACGAQFVGPDGELLHEVIREGDRLHEGLSALEVARIVGPPHHGGTMFRRDSHHEVGGYRHQFVVAQDIDLWLRLAERGKCVGQTIVYYRASIEAASISGRRRDEQFRLADLAIECAQSRRDGLDDQPLLDAFTARKQPRAPKGAASNAERARYYYYLGAMLRKKQPQVARRYFQRALREQPFHLKAFWRSVWG